MTKDLFNKIFNIFILAGMTVVMAVTTAIKLQKDGADTAMLLVAAFGAMMGILANVCSANAKILTFLFGFFDVSIYGVMCYLSGAYGNAALHLLYFVPMQFIGFYQWRKRSSSNKKELKARRLDPKKRILFALIFVAAVVAAYFILNFIDSKNTPDGELSMTYSFIKTAILTDAFSTICNIMGQYLMSTAYMEQWVLWIGVNISTIVLWSTKIARGDATDYGAIYVVKYSFYLLNSLNGLRVWLKLSKPQKA